MSEQFNNFKRQQRQKRQKGFTALVPLGSSSIQTTVTTTATTATTAWRSSWTSRRSCSARPALEPTSASRWPSRKPSSHQHTSTSPTGVDVVKLCQELVR